MVGRHYLRHESEKCAERAQRGTHRRARVRPYARRNPGVADRGGVRVERHNEETTLILLRVVLPTVDAFAQDRVERPTIDRQILAAWQVGGELIEAVGIAARRVA